jgi:hypothetical protein
MILTIIPIDGCVIINGVNYTKLSWNGTPVDVHALQWQEIEGWIECIDINVPNEFITALPNWTDNAIAAWDVANTPVPIEPPTAEDNKAFASNLLSATDWTTIADVADPINSPYLANQAEFITYRNLVRQIAVYPTAGDLVWPVAPTEVWA